MERLHIGHKRILDCFGVAATMLLVFTTIASAQETLRAFVELPEAPIPQTSTSAQLDQGTASITGVLTDVQGAVILGATIILEDATSHEKRETLSDTQGAFKFATVNAGIFSITIQAKSFAPVVKTGILLRAGEDYQLSSTTMQIAAAASTVEVGAQTQYELAEAQIKAQEKQRFLFIQPNFYVSYIANPAPLTAGQKMRLAFRATIDPFHLVNNALNAGWDQWRNNDPGYGQGAAGYAKRFAIRRGTHETIVLNADTFAVA